MLTGAIPVGSLRGKIMLVAFSHIINGKIYIMYKDNSKEFIQVFTDKGKLQFNNMDDVSSFMNRKARGIN